MLRNFTPHPIVLRIAKADPNGELYEHDVTVEPDPRGPARVRLDRRPLGHLMVEAGGRGHAVPHIGERPLIDMSMPAIDGWTPAYGPAIVSRAVLEASPAAGAPLYAPDTGESAVRDGDGNIIAVRALISRLYDGTRKTSMEDPPW